MTREEAKEFIAQSVKSDVDMALVADAIKVLEQEPTTKIEESNFSQEQYLADIQSAYDCGKSVIDKIRAEIKGMTPTYHNPDWSITDLVPISEVLKLVDKYKAETEET